MAAWRGSIPPGARHELDGVEVAVACDVTNPLCGPDGASAVYGPQKGATPRMVATLDRNLAHFASIVERDLGVAIKDLPGSGAAGGLGGGLVAFAGGKLSPGIDLVIKAVDLESRLENADLCLTGEGAIDGQSAFGKTAVGVARLARSLRLPGAGPGRLDRPGRSSRSRPGNRRLFLDLPRPDRARPSDRASRASCWSKRPSKPCGRSWRGDGTTN